MPEPLSYYYPDNWQAAEVANDAVHGKREEMESHLQHLLSQDYLRGDTAAQYEGGLVVKIMSSSTVDNPLDVQIYWPTAEGLKGRRIYIHFVEGWYQVLAYQSEGPPPLRLPYDPNIFDATVR